MESFTLGIYGNANMDGTIDEMDIAYVEGVINATNASTNLSDANYDGKVDSSDLDQIRRTRMCQRTRCSPPLHPPRAPHHCPPVQPSALAFARPVAAVDRAQARP